MNDDFFGVRKTVLVEFARDNASRDNNPAVTHQMVCTNFDLCTLTSVSTCKCIDKGE